MLVINGSLSIDLERSTEAGSSNKSGWDTKKRKKASAVHLSTFFLKVALWVPTVLFTHDSCLLMVFRWRCTRI
jgi:hypothetical protein